MLRVRVMLRLIRRGRCVGQRERFHNALPDDSLVAWAVSELCSTLGDLCRDGVGPVDRVTVAWDLNQAIPSRDLAGPLDAIDIWLSQGQLFTRQGVPWDDEQVEILPDRGGAGPDRHSESIADDHVDDAAKGGANRG